MSDTTDDQPIPGVDDADDGPLEQWEFDLESLGTYLADEGVWMPLVDPRNNMPMLLPDKTPVHIRLRGRSSEAFRVTMERIQKNRAKLRERNEDLTDKVLYREDTDILVACTAEWTIPTWKKKPFACTQTNARALWTDVNYRWLRERALAFILDDRRFLRPAPLLGGTPDISSG